MAQGPVVVHDRVQDPASDRPRLRKLKKGRIRGVMSEGMLCSGKELGLSADHSAIFVLDPAGPVGRPLAEWLGGAALPSA